MLILLPCFPLIACGRLQLGQPYLRGPWRYRPCIQSGRYIVVPRPTIRWSLWNSRVPFRHRDHTLCVVLPHADLAAVRRTLACGRLHLWTTLTCSRASIRQHSFLFFVFYTPYREQRNGFRLLFFGGSRTSCCRFLCCSTLHVATNSAI